MSEIPASQQAVPEIPEFAFDPDNPWAQTFQMGLKRANLEDRTVYEVGVGAGINVAYMLKTCGARRVYGRDLDPRLVELAERNLFNM